MGRLCLRNNRFKFKTLDKIANHFGGMYGIHLKLRKKENTERYKHVTDSTLKHLDLNRFLPKFPPGTLQTILESHTILGDTIAMLIFLYLTSTY
jgi:hypothetical protein